MPEGDKYIDFSKFDSIDTVNWDYWNLLPSWNLEEVACLLLEIDPDVLDDSERRDKLFKSKRGIALRKLTKLLKRTHEAEEIDDLMSPQGIIEWASANRVFVPPGLANCKNTLELVNYRALYYSLSRKYKKLKKEIESQKTDSDHIDDLSPKKLKSIYNVLYVMSVHGYHFSMDKNNTAVGKILMSLEKEKLLSPKRDAILGVLEDAWNFVRRREM